jgi:hypothetical protein
MNWIKVPTKGEGDKLINLDFIVRIEPGVEKEDTNFVHNDSSVTIITVPFETIINQIKPILTTTDLSGNQL